MANIKPYDTAAGKRYRVRYRKPDGTQTDKRGFRTKKEAEVWAASTTMSKALGEYIDPQLGKALVEHLAPSWLAAQEAALKPSTYRIIESAWRTHVRPEWGDREVSKIKPSEVQLWVAMLLKSKSVSTVARALGVLAGILEQAIDDRRLSRNPARGVKLPRKTPKPRVYLTHDQVHRLAAASAHPELVLTLAYTGLRWGEASGLRVRNLNQVRARLMVEENAVMVGSVVHVGTPKTHRKRSVPYPKFLGSYLRSVAAGKPSTALLFGDGDSHLQLPSSGDGWFEAAVRKVQVEDRKAVALAKAEGESDLPDVMPRVTPHDLRHTAASLAISSGASVKAVQRMLGHASAAMTLDTYADLFDDDLDAVGRHLDESARAASVGKMWAKHVA